jgi:drug/metabolite transporter (DMT)-like permease
MREPNYACGMNRIARIESAPTRSPPDRAAASVASQSLRGRDIAAYAATILFWGTSWIALRAQLGIVPPEVSIFWRFLVAAGLMWAWVSWRGERMRFPAADHLRFAGTGLCMFSMNFTLFYYGGISIPSGLLSVVFSLASIGNLLLGALFLRQRIEARVACGALVGAVGIACLFWPEIAKTGLNGAALGGLALCIGGTTFFCLGNMISTTIQRRGVPLLSAVTWGMTYGAAIMAAVSLVRGDSFAIDPSAKYIVSLAVLAVGASVIAFSCYLTLLRRIGAARAGYSTVLFPIVALAVSTLFEGYIWTPLAMLGVVLALAGNVLVLRRKG